MFGFLLQKRTNVLGMNARNIEYVRPLNRSRARAVADHKLRSKQVLRRAGVPTPESLGTIRTHADLETFAWESLPASFVIKPNRGFGGGGIIVLFGRKKGRADAWVKASGGIVTVEDLKNHAKDILDGHFSLTEAPDVVMFEERLRLHPIFRPYTYRGIPDIRVIVFNSIPVMAMLRLPTKESDGKANLQQGAIGVGIDIASGITTTAIHGKGHTIEYVPGTDKLLSGIKIPHWNDVLRLSVEAQRATNIGFLGADIVIDRDRGPVFLELNARPGLSIQLANRAGLKGRLDRVKNLTIKTVARGVAVGKSLFGGEIEEEIEDISGKRVIGSVEKVTLIGRDSQEITVDAKIDTGAHSSSIDRDLARQLGYGATLDAFDNLDLKEFGEITEKGLGIDKKILTQYGEKVPDLIDVSVTWSANGVTIRPMVEITFILDTVRTKTKANIIDRGDLSCSIIIGKRNLHKFLVDVSKAQ